MAEGGKPGTEAIDPSRHDAELEEQWRLVTTPLGEHSSGRARYSAAMYFHKRGVLDDEALEVYRLCSRLDAEDPLPMIRERGAGRIWLTVIEDHLKR